VKVRARSAPSPLRHDFRFLSSGTQGRPVGVPLEAGGSLSLSHCPRTPGQFRLRIPPSLLQSALQVNAVPFLPFVPPPFLGVVFTTTRSPQRKLFWSTVFESSRQHKTYTTTLAGSGCSRGLRLVSAVWMRVFDVDVSPSERPWLFLNTTGASFK
jgi:hypothetical protein